MRSIAAGGRFALVESLLNTWPLGDDLNQLDHWYSRGVRIVGFVHAGNNQYADSSRPAFQFGDRQDEHGGLTPLGHKAVARLNDLGVLIDVSQLSDKAFDQVLAESRAPVIASHSALRAKVDATRNLTDDQLAAIASRGGVVGIVGFSAYLRARSPETLKAVADLQTSYGFPLPAGTALSKEKQVEYDHAYHDIVGREPKATVAELADSIDYAVKAIGIDHVAIASDFNHGGGVEGWRDVSQAGAVTAELKRRGYGEAQVAQLWSGNVLRVWQSAIDARNLAYRPAIAVTAAR